MGGHRRLPQAPSEPIPELAEFLSRFRVHFSFDKSAHTLERYITGLLTEHPNKNCDTIAEVVPGTNEQQLNHLLTEMVWDETDLNHQRNLAMLDLATERDGVLVFDDSGFAKQGAHSVGVQRQYSGTLGKVANCQVTVNCHYAERTIAWPVSTRLYLPRSWAESAERRRRAHVPETIAFQTKAEIALGLLDEARAWGVPGSCIVVDADYGDNPNFLNGLEARKERCCVAIRCDFSVTLVRRGGEPVQRADRVVSVLPAWRWRTIRWAEGERGELRARFAAVRCWRVDADGALHVGWLIGQKPCRGQTGDRKYFWSNYGASVELERMVEYAHRRHWVEQYHEEAKGELGWDQFQGRRWDAFHRNAVTVMLTYSFLVWEEWRERVRRRRPGPVRRAFSPSAGSAATVAAGHPSPRRRLDAVRRDA